jgi:hypothetical protein
MASRSWWVLALLAAPALAQIGDFSGWDRFYTKPKAPLTAIAPEATVTLLINHSYPVSLHHLRATVSGEAVEQVGGPVEMAELVPTEIVELPLALRRREGAAGDQATLRVTFTADEIRGSGDVDLAVPLTPAGEAQVNDSNTMPVGSLDVVITKTGHLSYALQCLGVVLVLLLLFWRKLRLRRG